MSIIDPGLRSNTQGGEPLLDEVAAFDEASSEQAVTEERTVLSVDIVPPSGVTNFPLTLG